MKKRRRRVRRKNSGFVRLTLLLLIIASLYVVVDRFLLLEEELPSKINQLLIEHQASTDKSEPSQLYKQKEQGRIVVVNIDTDTELPIKDTEYALIDPLTHRLIEVFTTDEFGRGTSGLYDVGTSYILKQQRVSSPYRLDKTEYEVAIEQRNQELLTSNKLPDYVRDYERLANGKLAVKDLCIPVETVIQLPELPNGCEITSLTSVLNTYGYDVSKLDMADNYLPKEYFDRVEGKLYGANPYHAYAGDPRDKRGGFFSYAPPIIQAGQDYLATVGGQEELRDISGSSPEEILAYLDQGLPVVIWVTLDLSKPKINYYWHFRDTGEKFDAPVNLHCVVLHGYTEDEVYVMDPLKGLVKHNLDTFFASYADLGSHALVVIQE